MTSLNGNWTGRISGTNNADIFFEIEESDKGIKAELHINDPAFGRYAYECICRRDGARFSLQGEPILGGILDNDLGSISASGEIIGENVAEGIWQSSIGTKGTFIINRVISQANIEEKSINHSKNNTAFVMMSISGENSSEQEALNAIKRATSTYNIEAIRVDEIEHSGKTTELILEKIKESHFLICDLTNERPNVYYELGYAHSLQKNVILVAKEGTNIHFDIKDYNVIFYKNYSQLEKRISHRIGKAL